MKIIVYSCYGKRFVQVFQQNTVLYADDMTVITKNSNHSTLLVDSQLNQNLVNAQCKQFSLKL